MLLAVKSYHTDSAGQAVGQDSQDVVAVVRACRDKLQSKLLNNLKNNMNKVSPWLTLLPLLLGYAAFVFVAVSLTKITDGHAVPYIFSIFYPILMLSGAWAVLGPGSYAVRTTCSIAAVFTIVLAGILGFWITLPDDLALALADSPLSLAEIFLALSCIGIPLICATQLPYWLGRLIFGWQLIDEAKPPKQKKIDLKDMLTITAILAVCLVAPTKATSMLYGSFFVDSVKVGDREHDFVTDPATGESTWEEIVVSEENIDRFKREHAAEASQAQYFGLMFVAGYMVLIALFALVNIPCFYLGMSNENAAIGFCLAALYWLSLITILFIVSITITQPRINEFSFVILYTIFPSLLFAGAAATPMFVARANGGKLVSRSFFRKPAEKSESLAPQKVADPFGD